MSAQQFGKISGYEKWHRRLGHHHHHYSFIHFVRRQVFCFGVGQGWTGTMGFAGGVISPLAVSSDLVPASAMGTQRLGQPSEYPLLHPPDQPDLVQTRPTPTLAGRLTFPRSPQRSFAGRQCAQQQPGYPRDRTGAWHPTSASNEDTPRWPRSNHPVRVVTPATVHPPGGTAARPASPIGPEVGVRVGTRRHR